MNLHEFTVHESTVEYASASSFAAQGFASLRGTEVDGAGERTGPDAAVLRRVFRPPFKDSTPHSRTTPSNKSCARYSVRRTRR